MAYTKTNWVNNSLPGIDEDNLNKIEDGIHSIDVHTSRADNPHSVTKDQVGLGKVDNTADADKPVSSAVVGALNGKSDKGHVHDGADKIDHTNLLNKGANTHAQIDTHIAQAITKADILTPVTSTNKIVTESDISGGSDTLAQHLTDASNPHHVSKSQVGLGNVPNLDTTSAVAHPGATGNPHNVTKAQVGLSNVPNVDTSSAVDHVAKTDNPHNVTKDQIGLSNVDNTSDDTKPVSSAVQTALDGKVDNSRVLTDVPANAVFTDTVYDDSNVPKYSDIMGKNFIINGGFDVWQRGTSFTGTSIYIADRWVVSNNTAGGTIERLHPGTAFHSDGISIYANASHPDNFNIQHRIENIRALQNTTVTLSMKVWSTISDKTVNVEVRHVDTDGSTTVWKSPTVELGKTVANKSVTMSRTFDIPGWDVPVAQNRAQFRVLIYPMVDHKDTGIAIGEIQLERGPVATEFEQRPKALELMLCYRYYEKWTGSLLPVPYLMKEGTSGNKVSNSVYFKSRKRVAPTVTGTLSDGTFTVWATPTTSGFGLYSIQNGGSTCVLTSWIADAEL